MRTITPSGECLFRVWIARCDRPPAASNEPAIVTELAEEGTMSEIEAAAYVAAFNRAAANWRRRIRAVAVPVAVRYDGDLRPGQAIAVSTD